VDKDHVGKWVKTPVLPAVDDAIAIAATRSQELAHHDGRSELCALRASGEIVCTTFHGASDPRWSVHSPLLAADFEALFDGPCGRRKNGKLACAWYDAPRWAEILRAVERIPDVRSLRVDATPAAACAIQNSGRVVCVRTSHDGHPRHLLPRTASPVHVAFP
jgi:hypothetical protein